MRDKLAFMLLLTIVVALGLLAAPLFVALVLVGAAFAAVAIPLMFGIMMLSLMRETWE